MYYPALVWDVCYATSSHLFDAWIDGLPPGKYRAGDLYSGFSRWQKENGEEPISHKRFSSMCRQYGMIDNRAGGVRYMIKKQAKAKAVI